MKIDKIIEEAIPLWEDGTNYRVLYANRSCCMSNASGASSSICFPIMRILISLKVKCIVVLTNL